MSVYNTTIVLTSSGKKIELEGSATERAGREVNDRSPSRKHRSNKGPSHVLFQIESTEYRFVQGQGI